MFVEPIYPEDEDENIEEDPNQSVEIAETSYLIREFRSVSTQTDANTKDIIKWATELNEVNYK